MIRDTTTDLTPLEALSGDARQAVGLCLPDCRLTWDTDDGTGHLDALWLLAPDAWASIDPYDGVVRQAGSRRLWDEAKAPTGGGSTPAHGHPTGSG